GADLGGPAGSYVAVLLATEIGKSVYKLTNLDIIITPFVTILAGFFTGKFFGIPVNQFMVWLGEIINWCTEQRPFIMGILVAVLLGSVFTAPISSAAIAIFRSIDGLAAGASFISCSAQIIGISFHSYKDKRFGEFLAQASCTPMLQVPKILKKPIIDLPPTLASMVVAPFATVWLQMSNNTEAAGMGTSGLVGPI